MSLPQVEKIGGCLVEDGGSMGSIALLQIDQSQGRVDKLRFLPPDHLKGDR